MNRFFGAVFGFVTAYTVFHFAMVLFGDGSSKSTAPIQPVSQVATHMTTTASVHEEDPAASGPPSSQKALPLAMQMTPPISPIGLPAVPAAAPAIAKPLICAWTDEGKSAVESVSADQMKSFKDDGSVYQVGDRLWSQAQEAGFGKWVKANVDAQFMQRYQLSGFDSAQAAAAVRAIYARSVNLPAMFVAGKNSKPGATAELKSEIGHFSKNWASLPTVMDWSGDHWKTAILADQRFRAYLDAVKQMVSATNIIYNTYPLALTDPHQPGRLSSFVHEGAAMVDLNQVQLVRSISPGSEGSIDSLAQSQFPVELGRGLVSWRWVFSCNGKWAQVSAPSMPGFSMQQYRIPTEANLAAAEKQAKELNSGIQVRESFRRSLAQGKKQLTEKQMAQLEKLNREIATKKRSLSLVNRTIGLYQKNPRAKYHGSLASILTRLVDSSRSAMNIAAGGPAVGAGGRQSMNPNSGLSLSPSLGQKLNQGLTQKLDQSSVR